MTKHLETKITYKCDACGKSELTEEDIAFFNDRRCTITYNKGPNNFFPLNIKLTFESYLSHRAKTADEIHICRGCYITGIEVFLKKEKEKLLGTGNY